MVASDHSGATDAAAEEDEDDDEGEDEDDDEGEDEDDDEGEDEENEENEDEDEEEEENEPLPMLSLLCALSSSSLPDEQVACNRATNSSASSAIW